MHLLTHQWSKEHPWLKDPPNGALRQRINDFDKALKAGKKGGKGTGFPKFRSRHIERHQTLRFPHNRTKKKPRGNITPTQRGVRLPKMPSRIRWTKHRPLEGRLKSVTVKRENNRWFAVCLCELEDVLFTPPTSEAEVIGIDMGLKPTIARCSDGTKFDTQNVLSERRKETCPCSAGAQPQKERKCKPTESKTKSEYGPLPYQVPAKKLCPPDDHVDSQACSFYWGRVLEHCRYDERPPSGQKRCRPGDGAIPGTAAVQGRGARGREVFPADHFFASSQQCSTPGCDGKKKMPRGVQTYRCEKCGIVMDRNLNAAINLRMVTVEELRRRGHCRTHPPESGEYACGDTAVGEAGNCLLVGASRPPRPD